MGTRRSLVIAFLIAGSVAGIGRAVFFLGGALRSMGFAAEMGLGFNPGVLVFVAAAEIGKFATAFDYARWHLVPGLEVPILREIGVVLAVAGAAALVWTDRRLARHFSTAASAAQVITDGPSRPGCFSGTVAYSPDPVDAPADGNVVICCSRPSGDLVLDL